MDYIIHVRPVPFEVNGARFALRQARWDEQDRLRYAQATASDWAHAQAVKDGLDLVPVSDEMQQAQALLMQALEAEFQEANASNDGDEARRLADEMEAIEQNMPANRAEERAREHSRRAVARWMVDNLIVCEDGSAMSNGQRQEFVKATLPDPLDHVPVIEATQRILRLINYRPNFTKAQE